MKDKSAELFVIQRSLSERPDDIAPDGSEIRLLASLDNGGLCHCTLPARRVSLAVKHQTVGEIWYFLDGEGQVWRQLNGQQVETAISPGTCLTIPVGTHFQFRNTGDMPLRFVIVTMPPWPGMQEAERVQDHWDIL